MFWDVSNVTDMSYMFYGAKKFNPFKSFFITIDRFYRQLDWRDKESSFKYTIDGKGKYLIDPITFKIPKRIHIYDIRILDHYNQKNFLNLSFDLSNMENNVKKESTYDEYTLTDSQLINIEEYLNNYNLYIDTNWIILYLFQLNIWDLSNVKNMDYMFKGASSFNKNISKWCTPLINIRPIQFYDSETFDNKNEPEWSKCKLTSNTLYKLVNNYFKNDESKEKIISKYGEIDTWDVSEVTYMDGLFADGRIYIDDKISFDQLNKYVEKQKSYIENFKGGYKEKNNTNTIDV